MTRAAVLSTLALLILVGAEPAPGQEEETSRETSREATEPSQPAPPRAPQPAEPAPGVKESGSPPDRSKPPRPRGKAVRTLDEITIEGEIAVPQVLFITARDRQRYLDLLHRRYRQSSLELGRATALPTTIVAHF